MLQGYYGKKEVHTHKFEEPAIPGVVLARYATTPGHGWSGTYLVWKLEDFVGVDMRQGSFAVNRKTNDTVPHKRACNG